MRVTVILASLMLLLPAMRAEAAPAKTSAARTFTLRIADEPETLDWNRAHTPVETYLLMNLMEGLVTYDSKMQVVPALAKSWTVSPDGRTYTFKLRPDVKWSDGVPLKAQDFVTSWKRLLAPMTAASYAYFLFDVEGADAFNKGTLKDFNGVGVKAIDDRTLQVKLTKPVAHWIHIPTFWVTFPLREDVIQKHGTGWERPGRMVTLGPYSLVSHDLDSKITLQANPNYYGTRGNIDQIVFLIVRDASTAMSLYDAGKLDFVTDLSAMEIKRLQGNPELRAFPYLKTGYLGYVLNKYPLSNPHVRRAISMAIDRSKLPQVLHGGQQPATSFIPPTMLAHSKSLGLPFNPEKARAELKASGLDLTRPITIDVLVMNWDKPLTIAQFIQGELKKNLGINVQLQPFDNKTFRANLDLHSFPLFISSWSADYPDPDNFLSMWLSSAGNNRTTWKNAKYDQMIIAARGGQNPKAREKTYVQAQKLLQEEDAIILPLYYEPNIALVKPRVQGLELNPINYLLLRKVNLK